MFVRQIGIYRYAFRKKGYPPYRIYKRYTYSFFVIILFLYYVTNIYLYIIRIRFGIDSISFKIRTWEARNGYNFIRDDALQVAVCVIAIFLDILYGNLLYVIHCEARRRIREKKNLCVYVPFNKLCGNE